jgi:hypothetical protein
MSREDDWRRVSAMAGLDAEGGIAPPPPGATISRKPTQWKRTDYSALLTEQRPDHSSFVGCVRQLRAAALKAERKLGGPVYISKTVEIINVGESYVVTYTFRRADQEDPSGT